MADETRKDHDLPYVRNYLTVRAWYILTRSKRDGSGEHSTPSGAVFLFSLREDTRDQGTQHAFTHVLHAWYCRSPYPNAAERNTVLYTVHRRVAHTVRTYSTVGTYSSRVRGGSVRQRTENFRILVFVIEWKSSILTYLYINNNWNLVFVT